MRQSIYARLSKEVGWPETVSEFPDEQIIYNLNRDASQGDLDAFKRLFWLLRTLPRPSTQYEARVMNILLKAFYKVRVQYLRRSDAITADEIPRETRNAIA